MENEKDFDIKESAKLSFELRCAAAYKSPKPNAEKAFEEFMAKNGKTKRANVNLAELDDRRRLNRYAIYAVSTIAASVAIFFIINIMLVRLHSSEHVVYVAANSENENVCVLLNGKELDAESQMAQNLGIRISEDQLVIDGEQTQCEDIHQAEVVVPSGKTMKITLPDGSRVHMASGSRLVFPTRFRENARRMVSLQGEAYFEVEHNESSPFTVDCDHFETKVLGTTFNVRNVSGSTPEVTLVNGRVAVTSGKLEVVLKPEQMASLSDNGEITVSQADIDVVTSWKDGTFYFDGQSMRDILLEVGRWYNMDVVFVSREHIGDKIHFNAERSWSAKETIDCLNQLSDAKIVIEGGRIRVN